MTDKTRRASALESRIAQGKADPIGPAEKILVAELREGFERKFGSPGAAVVSTVPAPSSSAEIVEDSIVQRQPDLPTVDLAAVVAQAIRDHASGEADLSGFPLEVSIACTVADALIEGMNSQYLNPLTGKSRELMAGEIHFPDMLDAIDFIKASCKLNPKDH